jgi:hypothetical protein
MQIPEGNIAYSVSKSEERKTNQLLEQLIPLAKDISNLYKSSQSWFWRTIVLIVALSTVVSVVFQILSYFKR